MAPIDGAIDVPLNTNVSATFDEEIDPATVNELSFSLMTGATPIAATLTLAGTTVTWHPAADLAPNTEYTAIVTTEVMDLAGIPMAADVSWTFATGTSVAQGPRRVPLGTAGDFAILAKAGIDSVPTSQVTGDVGVSPIDSTALTGFSLTLDGSGAFATSSQIIGKAYAPDYVGPTAAKLTAAVSNMEAAYTDAAGRTGPDFVELGGGEIGGLTLVPGLYKWGTGVLITTDVTLAGGPDDVWIFQIGGGVTQATATSVLLAGGASPANIFWQSAGAFAMDTGAHFEGIVLSQTEVTLATSATVNGRIFSQTAVTLDAATVTQPSR